MTTTETVNNFLEELTALSKKYNIIIHGCGCCGSPYLKVDEHIEQNANYSVDYGETFLDNLCLSTDVKGVNVPND